MGEAKEEEPGTLRERESEQVFLEKALRSQPLLLLAWPMTTTKESVSVRVVVGDGCE